MGMARGGVLLRTQHQTPTTPPPPRRQQHTLLQDKPKSCGVHGVEVRKARYLELILSSDTDSRSVEDSDSDPRLPPLQYFGLTPPPQR
jgi:hypothetical protein